MSLQHSQPGSMNFICLGQQSSLFPELTALLFKSDSLVSCQFGFSHLAVLLHGQPPEVLQLEHFHEETLAATVVPGK